MENFEKQSKMPVSPKPETVKAESEAAVAPFLESERRIATETGKFYSSIIDTYLGAKTPEEQQEQSKKLIETLPGPMRKLYEKGLNKFQEGLSKNRELLEQHRGDEVRYLLSVAMSYCGSRAEEIERVLQHTGMAHYIEPSPGVAIIEAEKDLFGILQEHSIVGWGMGAVTFPGQNPTEPSFLLIKQGSRKEIAQKLRHEMHHFIWNFLQREGDFLRKIKESSPGLSTAFRWFREEIAAYICNRGDWFDVASADEKLLTYTSDEKILKRAGDVRDFAALCMAVAEHKGVNPQTFLYAPMTSRNFAELRKKFLKLTPFASEGKPNQEDVDALYFAWDISGKAVTKVAEFLKKKGATIPVNLVEECGLKRMISPRLIFADQIFSELRAIKKFARVVKAGPVDEKNLTERALRVRLPLPKETVNVILALPREQAKNILLGKSNEEFLESFVSFWSINQEATRAVYKQIIESSPAMRETFDKVRVRIISKGVESYRREFESSNEKRKQQIISEIEERTRLLIGL